MVVGRGGDYVLVATAYDEQMAVLYARNKSYAVVAKLAVEHFDEFTPLLGSKMSAVMVGDIAGGRECENVASHGHVAGLHVIAYARSLERPAALVYFIEVIAENGSIGHLAARRETFGDCSQQSRTSLRGKAVKVGCVGIFQRSLSAEPFHPMVAHAVTEYYKVFH